MKDYELGLQENTSPPKYLSIGAWGCPGGRDSSLDYRREELGRSHSCCINHFQSFYLKYVIQPLALCYIECIKHVYYELKMNSGWFS